jgi:hypothetical protein
MNWATSHLPTLWQRRCRRILKQIPDGADCRTSFQRLVRESCRQVSSRGLGERERRTLLTLQSPHQVFAASGSPAPRSRFRARRRRGTVAAATRGWDSPARRASPATVAPRCVIRSTNAAAARSMSVTRSSCSSMLTRAVVSAGPHACSRRRRSVAVSRPAMCTCRRSLSRVIRIRATILATEQSGGRPRSLRFGRLLLLRERGASEPCASCRQIGAISTPRESRTAMLRPPAGPGPPRDAAGRSPVAQLFHLGV